MDITGILNPPVWLEDETEYDIEIIKSLVFSEFSTLILE